MSPTIFILYIFLGVLASGMAASYELETV